MTWPIGAVKRWDIFCGACTTQNCLENTTARILEYRTNADDDRIVSNDASRLGLYYHCVRDAISDFTLSG